MNRIEVRASAAPAHLLRCSNSHYDCGSQLSNRGNRQYEMKLLYWMAAASEGRQPLSITAKMRIAACGGAASAEVSGRATSCLFVSCGLEPPNAITSRQMVHQPWLCSGAGADRGVVVQSSDPVHARGIVSSKEAPMAHAPQIKVPATYMRGGTSKGVFFALNDLPEAAHDPGPPRDRLLLR